MSVASTSSFAITSSEIAWKKESSAPASSPQRTNLLTSSQRHLGESNFKS
uniref:Uncharacterized protein n=1 Tax=Arundo donax TaxID=35708 RepID=A0A0A9DRS7_ARUDO